MEILTAPEPAIAAICGYGESGAGKTSVFTALDWSTDARPTRWGKRAVYVATDPKSASLTPVAAEDREHLIVVKPSLRKEGNKIIDDPHTEAVEIAAFPWQEKYPDVGTIIWDTGSQTAEKLLRAYANTGVFTGKGGDKHISVGIPNTKSFMALPMMGDYLAAQNAVLHILDFLLSQPLNVIFLCHPDIYTPEGGSGEMMLGGPGTIGGKAINRVAGKFEYVFRLDCKSNTVPDANGRAVTKMQYKAYSEKRGIWIGKFRKYPNPMPELDITGEPRKLIQTFDKLTLA